MSGYRGRCGYCGLMRECWPIQRFGGGNYRRGGRWYSGKICAECVAYIVHHSRDRRTTDSASRYSVGALRRLAERINAESPPAP